MINPVQQHCQNLNFFTHFSCSTFFLDLCYQITCYSCSLLNSICFVRWENWPSWIFPFDSLLHYFSCKYWLPYWSQSQVQEWQYMGLNNLKLSKNSSLFPYSELEEMTDWFPKFWANMHQFFFTFIQDSVLFLITRSARVRHFLQCAKWLTFKEL